MVLFPLKITVVDEICISTKKGAGNHYDTLDYIPGRVLWGAIASMSGEAQPGEKPDNDFMRIFYSGDVIFANAYPSNNVAEGYRSAPIPLSARAKKAAPGFSEDDDTVYYRPDDISDWLYGIPPDISFEDYTEYERFHYSYKTVSVPKSFTVHHERHGLRGTTKAGKLFSRENIPAGTVFWGYIRALNNMEEPVGRLFAETGIKMGVVIPLGRKPGRVRIEWPKEAEARVFSNNINDTIVTEFTLTCYSDTILMDDYHRYLSHIPAEYIKDCLIGVVLNCSLMEPYFAAPVSVTGWNGAYRRPAEVEIAVSKGSAFRYKCTLEDGKSLADLRESLMRLQEKGIGLRRQEGFGEIRINDKFHYEKQWRQP